MKTVKALLAVVIVTAVVAVAVFALTRAAGSPVTLPEKVASSTPCPVAGCMDATCHGAGEAPPLTDGSTMTCPKVGCQDTSCHAADRLTSHYRAPKNASLNVWIVGLSAFTLAMVAVAANVK